PVYHPLPRDRTPQAGCQSRVLARTASQAVGDDLGRPVDQVRTPQCARAPPTPRDTVEDRSRLRTQSGSAPRESWKAVSSRSQKWLLEHSSLVLEAAPGASRYGCVPIQPDRMR